MPYSQETVAKGARFMDKILPGWYKVVQVEHLHMDNGALCLLGQTFGVHNERSLAKEMYPEEWQEATKAVRDRRNGYEIASGYGGSRGGHMLSKLMTKHHLHSYDDEEEYMALERVCAGSNTKCEWAVEIANRLAADEAEEEARR